jgi:hypothetical protein
MVLILPILLLMASAALILAIRAVRPNFPALWLIAVVGSLTAWLVTLFLRIRLPASFTLVDWAGQTIYSASPGLLLDYSSWPYAFAIASLVLAVVLVSPGHLRLRSEVVNVAGSLALGGLGLLAVLAANPVSLLLGWAAMDLIELSILMRTSADEHQDRAVIQVFTTRVAGIMIALWTFVVASREAGFNTSFSDLSPLAGIPLLISIGLRVGIFPLHLPFTGEGSLRRGQGTLLRMVPAASGLVVLSRIPSSAISRTVADWLGLFALLALLFTAFRWVMSRDELNARPYWLVSLTAVGILAVLVRQPEASLSWGVSLVFIGSAIFLLENASRFTRVTLGVGLICMLGLPFTANASGMLGLASGKNFFWIILEFIGIFMLVVGAMDKVLRKPEIPEKLEQIIYLTYPLSILLLVLGYLFVGLFGWHGSRTVGAWWISVPLFLAVTAWVVLDRRTGRPTRWLEKIRSIGAIEEDRESLTFIQKFADLEWFYSAFRYLSRGLGSLVNAVTFLLEGSAGIFWAILVLVLFFAVLNLGGK